MIDKHWQCRDFADLLALGFHGVEARRGNMDVLGETILKNTTDLRQSGESRLGRLAQ
jgi:hypothetical protein